MRKGIKKNNQKVKLAIWLLLLVGVSVFVYYFYGRTSENSSTKNDTLYIVPALTELYTNSIYNFSLNIPADFSVQESDLNGSHTIVFESAKSEGIQIVVSPYNEKGVRMLTKEMIQAAIPDLKITDNQVLDVGESYRGLAFKSDNEAFDGDSREVWFIFKDNLFQISTYSRFDELLKAMFATWEFK